MNNTDLDSAQMPDGYLDKVYDSALEIARTQGYIEGERHLREALTQFPEYIDSLLRKLKQTCSM